MTKYIIILILFISCSKEEQNTSTTPVCHKDFIGVWTTTGDCTPTLDIRSINDNYININGDVSPAIKCNEFFGIYSSSKVHVRGYYVNDSTINVQFSAQGDTCKSTYVR